MIITGKKFSKPDMSRVINGDTILAEEPEQTPKFRLDLLLVEITTGKVHLENMLQ